MVLSLKCMDFLVVYIYVYMKKNSLKTHDFQGPRKSIKALKYTASEIQ